jgi:uncharacterized protein (TIGR02391 family)
MVPIDFHRYRTEIRQVLLARLQSLANGWDPFVAAWICYALAADGIKNNQPILQLRERMQRWRLEEDVWKYTRNIGPMALLLWLSEDCNPDAQLAEKLSRTIKQLDADDKFSPLRDGEQVFLLALGVRVGADEEASAYLKDLVAREMQRGSLRRRILYAAALRELGETTSCPAGEPQDEGDVIALVWWTERYGGDKYGQWAGFYTIQERIALDIEAASEGQRVLTVPELALLYEAVARETEYSDPNLLFESYPLHPRIRQVAERDFKQGNYSGAVFEACKALEDFLKTISGSTKIGVSLVSEILGKPDMNPSNFSPPLIKINPLDQNSVDFISQIDEQAGFSSLTIGIFRAFRNPKGHQPKDKAWVGINAYEALDQLITISLVIKRIEKAIYFKP